jgi:heme oxygenase
MVATGAETHESNDRRPVNLETFGSEGLPALVSSVTIRGRQQYGKAMPHKFRRRPAGRGSAEGASGKQGFFGLRPRRLRAAAAQNDPITALHRSVRAATRGEQTIIEGIMAKLDFARRDDYGLFLIVHYAALQTLESDWRAADRDDFSLMMQCLRDDVLALGVLPTRLFLLAPGILGVGVQLGISYIIRGSRLSAQFLRSRVAPEFTVSYLKCLTRTNWDQFLRDVAQVLEDRTSNISTDDIIQGAQIAMQRIATLFEHATLRDRHD